MQQQQQQRASLQGARLSSRNPSNNQHQHSSELSTSISSTKLSRRPSKSFKVAAQEAAGSLITCFIPLSRNKKNPVEEHEEDAALPQVSTPVPKVPQLKFKTPSREQISQLSNIRDIIKATNNFSTSNKIGEGHFGTIFQATLKDGSVLAVKRAKKNAYEKHILSEFKSEIETLSSIEHMNLVRFLGYLEEEDERVIMVEHVSNGNLREHLTGSRGTVLEIAERLQIAIDVAHAITYLHTYTDKPIIHRDIKASNILITDKLRAKVADFGFARLAPDGPDVSHVVTQVKGTAGYLDPEYLKTYQLSEKSDVYSFGVLLVEIVSGRRPIEPKRPKERMTIIWAMQRYKEGDVVMVMDPSLRRSSSSLRVVEKMLGLAQLCLAPSRHDRPSMKKCAEVLWDIRKESHRQEDLEWDSSRYESEVESSDKQHDTHDLSSRTAWELEDVRQAATWDIHSPVQAPESMRERPSCSNINNPADSHLYHLQ